MSAATPSFDFSQFVPGFDFLKSLTAAVPGTPGAASAIPNLSSWVAPTLSVEELEKRIQELKTVQYWLEQNGHALKATIQALEVQKMTLSTLRGMNVRMEDLANAFTRSATPATTAAAPAAPAAAPTPREEPSAPEAPTGARDASPDEAGATEATGGAGVVDPLQWWGALTQQFQQIASSAMKDAAHLKMPGAPDISATPPKAKPSRVRAAAGSTSRKTATASNAKSKPAAVKKPAPPRTRPASR